MAAEAFKEYGRSGLNRWGGYVQEEFLRELRGRKGVETYREMSENDDVIGAVLFAIEMLMRQVPWDIEKAGPGDADAKAAEFVFSCLHDMESTWTDFLSEALSFLKFGWSYHEIVYKRRMGPTRRLETRSKHNDGLIGWRKLPIRSQDTLWEWAYDENGDSLTGLVQCAPPKYEQVLVPLEKALHFRTKSSKGNPEGRSILRNAHRDWHFKRRIQEIEGIGIERDLAGLPVITPPEGTDLWAEDPESQKQLAMAERLVQGVRRDEREGVVLPPGWQLTLLSTGGQRQFDTNAVIERYDNRMAMTVLADFVLLGHEKVGSFALSSDKTEMFGIALGTFLDMICETFNSQGIPRLIDINGVAFKGITAYPRLIHGDIETQDLAKLGAFVKDMVGIGAITPDEGMEDYLRMTASLPGRDPGTTYMGGARLGGSGWEPPDGEEG